MNLDVTPVWHKNWDAIHALTVSGERRYRYIINEGSSRSSKTTSIIDCYDLYARKNKNKRLTVWRDTKKSCKDTVLNDALKHFRLSGRYNPRNFNTSESIFRYPSTNSTFEIHGTDDEVTVHGLTQDVAWLNEPYKISKDVFDQIDQRTADFVIIDWNPRIAHWVEDLKKDSRAIVIHSTFKDNSFCPPEQKRKILSYQPVSMCEIVVSELLSESKAKEYSITENELQFSRDQLEELSRCRENEYKNSASEYKWSVYGLGLKAEKPNRIYHFHEINVDEYLSIDAPTYYYSDWGSVDPWAIGEVKYYDGALYVREKNYSSENIIRQTMSPEQRELISSYDEGIVSYMFEKLGIDKDSPVICDTNRPMKIIALRSAGWDYAVGINKKESGSGKPGIVDRIDLLNNITVYYTSDSPNIRNEQENYSRKVDRYGTVLEEPEDFDNHHMDGLSYIAAFLQEQGVIAKI